MDELRKLTPDEITDRLRALDGWTAGDGHIVRAFQFVDFDAAMLFINAVADIARAQDHHPDLYNVYNRVVLKMSTHDAAGVTAKDFRFAGAVQILSV